VTLTELRRNLESYLSQAQSGDVIITKYGREVARLVGTGDSVAPSNTRGTPTSAEDEDEATSSGEASAA
jgi:prevent-host-death family protein